MRGFDEALLLDHPVLLSLSPLWHTMRSRAGSSGNLWSFDSHLFSQKFDQLLADVGLDSKTSPYQIRHGAASEAAASGAKTMVQITLRLRHGSADSSRRYEKHTRYLAEVGKLDASLVNYARWVEDHLAGVLSGTTRAPKFRPNFAYVGPRGDGFNGSSSSTCASAPG